MEIKKARNIWASYRLTSPQLNLIEMLWRFMKDEWIEVGEARKLEELISISQKSAKYHLAR